MKIQWYYSIQPTLSLSRPGALYHGHKILLLYIELWCYVRSCQILRYWASYFNGTVHVEINYYKY